MGWEWVAICHSNWQIFESRMQLSQEPGHFNRLIAHPAGEAWKAATRLKVSLASSVPGNLLETVAGWCDPPSKLDPGHPSASRAESPRCGRLAVKP